MGIDDSRTEHKKVGKYPPEFKASVALAAIMSNKTLLELSKKFDVHPSTISLWKNHLINHAELAFDEEIRLLQSRSRSL